MKTKAGWMLAMIIVTAGFFCLSQATLAQDGTKIHSSAERGLVVNEWEALMPEIVEEDDGRMWIRYNMPKPKGSYESFPFNVGDPLTIKWFHEERPGSVSDYPAGWSIEDTQAIVDWHMSGGRGDFVIEDGEWKEVPPEIASSSVSSQSSAPTASSADDDCSGPYCDHPVTGVQTVSSTNDPDRIIPLPPTPGDPRADYMRELKEAWEAARTKCAISSDPKDCKARDEAQRKYLDASVAGGN